MASRSCLDRSKGSFSNRIPLCSVTHEVDSNTIERTKRNVDRVSYNDTLRNGRRWVDKKKDSKGNELLPSLDRVIVRSRLGELQNSFKYVLKTKLTKNGVKEMNKFRWKSVGACRVPAVFGVFTSLCSTAASFVHSLRLAY